MPSKRTNNAVAKLVDTWKVKFYEAQKKIKDLEVKNESLLDSVNQLNLDKAELQSKLEAVPKGDGASLIAETEHLKLNDNMQGSLRNLVQQKFFQHWPFLDKKMFSQGNLITPATAHLSISGSKGQRYAVDIRRVCIAKTTYWRGYCAEQVRKEYISEYCTGQAMLK